MNSQTLWRALAALVCAGGVFAVCLTLSLAGAAAALACAALAGALCFALLCRERKDDVAGGPPAPGPSGPAPRPETGRPYEFFRNYASIDFSAEIAGARSIRAMFLYTDRFLRSCAAPLADFLAREGSSLELVVLSPAEFSEAGRLVARKYALGPGELAVRVEDIARFLRAVLLPRKSAGSSLRLSVTELLPTYALYMFDETAYVTLYSASGRWAETIPCFKITRRDDPEVFGYLAADFNAVLESAETRELGL